MEYVLNLNNQKLYAVDVEHDIRLAFFNNRKWLMSGYTAQEILNMPQSKRLSKTEVLQITNGIDPEPVRDFLIEQFGLNK